MGNKKNISVRLTDADLRSLKSLSQKLSIKESDLFRFAVKSALHRLMPLMPRDIHGIEFLLALLDCGQEVLKYFEFDTHQLDKMINQQGAGEEKVYIEDIELVVISVINPDYLGKRLVELGHTVDLQGNIPQQLRQYLETKYARTERMTALSGVAEANA